jgi:hypothetical protein
VRYGRSIAAAFLQVECLSDVCTADGLTTDPGLQAHPPHVTSQSTIKWPCQGLPGSRSWAIWRRFMKPYTRDSSNNRLRQTLGPWTRPDQRIWPVYYDSSSQMLCQMVQTPQHETATPGTANTSWQYYPAGIASTRRFIAVSKDAASFQDSRPPPDAVPVTVLKHLPYSGVPFRHCRPRLGMTRYEIRKLQRSPTTWQLYRCEQDLLADATEVEC